MRKLIMFAALAATTALANPAFSAEYEIKMLNKGEAGPMVFEPDFVRAEPGDVIRFISVDKGHNAQFIKKMLPEGAEKFKSKLSKDFELTVEKDGIYGVKCMPHYGMGMVALIAVGDPVNEEEARSVKHPGKAKKRFAAIWEKYDATAD